MTTTPKSGKPLTLDLAARAAARQPRSGVLARPRRACRHTRVRGAADPRVSGPGRHLAGGRQPARLPRPDGGLAGFRRPDRLHTPAPRDDRPLHRPAREPRARQAAALRHRHDPGRLRHGTAGREPHGATDQGRGQPGASGQPGSDRPVRPGLGAGDVRPRPVADRDPSRADQHLAGLRGRHPQGARRSRGAGRRSRPGAQRQRHLTEPGGRDRPSAEGLSSGALAPVRAGRTGDGRRRRRQRFRRVARMPLRPEPRRGGAQPRLRLPDRWAGLSALRPRLHDAASGARRHGFHEPALLRRDDTDGHRHPGRPPTAADRRTARDGGGGAGRRTGRRRGHGAERTHRAPGGLGADRRRGPAPPPRHQPGGGGRLRARGDARAGPRHERSPRQRRLDRALHRPGVGGRRRTGADRSPSWSRRWRPARSTS